MSDFFDHLLGENLDQASRLEPRPVSMYEATPGPMSLSGDEQNPEVDLSPPTGFTIPPRVQPAPSKLPVADPLPPTAASIVQRRLDELQAWLGYLPPQEEGKLREPAASQFPPPMHRPMALPPIPQPAAISPNTIPSEQTAQHKRPSQGSSPPQHTSPGVQPDAPAEVIVRSVTLAKVPSTPEAIVSPVHQSPPAHEEVAVRTPTIRPSVGTKDVHNSAVLTPRLTEIPRHIPQTRITRQIFQPPQQPVVNVTIGRLEVRAVHPSTTASRSSSRNTVPAVLSLEEYLTRRNGSNGL
jgi:hypothetical protein